MIEMVSVLILHSAFFIYLNITIYAWLNKAFVISKTMLYSLAVAAVVIILMHLLWPVVNDTADKPKLATLLCLSLMPIIAYFLHQYFIYKFKQDFSRQDAAGQKFYAFFVRFTDAFFKKLTPAVFTIIQFNIIWNADSF